MLKSLILSSVLAISLSATTASARHLKTPLEARIDTLQLQVARGMRSGALSPRELRRVNLEKRKFERRMALYLRDGFLTGREARKLNRMLDKGSALLARLLHNRERRFMAAVPVPRVRPVMYQAPMYPKKHMVKKTVWVTAG